MGWMVDGVHEHRRIQYDPSHTIIASSIKIDLVFKLSPLASLVGLDYMLNQIPGVST